jgi:hypothetical protein
MRTAKKTHEGLTRARLAAGRRSGANLSGARRLLADRVENRGNSPRHEGVVNGSRNPNAMSARADLVKRPFETGYRAVGKTS